MTLSASIELSEAAMISGSAQSWTHSANALIAESLPRDSSKDRNSDLAASIEAFSLVLRGILADGEN